MEFTEQSLLNEVIIKTSRSSGSGGQHVNKVSSRVELKFDIEGSGLFTEEEKKLIKGRLTSRLSSGNSIRVVCQEARSQLSNKQTCIRKLYTILIHALKQDKPRKATKPSRSAVERRLKEKQLISRKKISRQRDFD